MADNILLMPASFETMLAPQTTQACTELLAQTIWQLDKQIERAEHLLGADTTCQFLRAIGAHIKTELDTRLQLQRGRS